MIVALARKLAPTPDSSLKPMRVPSETSRMRSKTRALGRSFTVHVGDPEGGGFASPEVASQAK